MRQDLEACDLRKANDTAREGLIEILRDQLGNDLFTRTVDCVVLVKYAHFVFVRSDKFGKIAAVGAGLGMT